MTWKECLHVQHIPGLRQPLTAANAQPSVALSPCHHHDTVSGPDPLLEVQHVCPSVPHLLLCSSLVCDARTADQTTCDTQPSFLLLHLLLPLLPLLLLLLLLLLCSTRALLRC